MKIRLLRARDPYAFRERRLMTRPRHSTCYEGHHRAVPTIGPWLTHFVLFVAIAWLGIGGITV